MAIDKVVYTAQKEEYVRYKRKDRALLSGFTFLISPFLSLPVVLLQIYNRKRGALLLFSMFMGILSYLLLPDWTLDLARYYQNYDVIKNYSYQQFVDYLGLRTDYVFYVLFFVFSRLGLKFQFLLFLLSTFNFYVVFYVYEKLALQYNISRKKFFSFFILLFLSISILYYLSATRFSLACSFLTLSVYKFYFQEKKKQAYIFYFFAVLSHISLLVYLPFILIIQSVKNKKKLMFFSIALFGVMFFMPIEFVLSRLSNYIPLFSEKALIYVMDKERESSWALRLSHSSIIFIALLYVVSFYKSIPTRLLNLFLLFLLPVLVTFPFGFWVYDRFLGAFKVIFVYALFVSSFHLRKKLSFFMIKNMLYVPFLLYYAYSLYLYSNNMGEYLKISSILLVSIFLKTYTVYDIFFL